MKKYYGIDWLRAAACLGILAMHVATNAAYPISGFLYQRFIPSFTDFVFLFMAVSAFGMCSGYHAKVLSGQVDWTDFYKKRYGKILPFFGLLILVDLVMNFRISSVYEAVTELTLLHGFVPQSLSVIGVGWFLGTVFVFYLIFPFFCVLLETKCRAWFAFGVSVVLNLICANYFGLGRTNFLASACYFLAGGLIYLYRDGLQKIKWYVYLPVILLAVATYYLLGGNTFTRLAVVAALLACAVSVNIKKVGAVSFISGISLEIYLSHMVIFRVLEKLKLHTVIGNGWLQYFLTLALVTGGTVAFSYCGQKIIDKGRSLLTRKTT